MPCRGTGRSIALGGVAKSLAADKRPLSGCCAVAGTVVPIKHRVNPVRNHFLAPTLRLDGVAVVHIGAVVRRFLRDRNVMRMVLPHRCSRDADELGIASELFDRP